MQSRLRRSVEYFLSFGAFPGESIAQRGRRRIVVGYAWIGSAITLGPIAQDLFAGMPLVAFFNSLIIVAAIPGLFLMKAKPHLFGAITNVLLMIVFWIQLAVTALLGGLWASGLTVLFGLIFVLAAAIALSPRATALGGRGRGQSARWGCPTRSRSIEPPSVSAARFWSVVELSALDTSH